MSDAPPMLPKGRTVAVLLVLAIALTVAAVIHFAKPAATDNTDTVDKAEAPPADPQPVAYYLARADLARGEAGFSRCAPCHTIAPGGPNSIGPNLNGVMGQPIAARTDFRYSAAMRGQSGNWDWERLNAFLHSPRAAVPGTRMTFFGVSSPQDRADLMLYLNRQGGTLPMPAGAR